MSILKEKIFPVITAFFKENETKIALFVGFLLISGISFEIGVLQGQKWQSQPLIIEKQVSEPQGGEMPKSELPGTTGPVSNKQNDAILNSSEPAQTQAVATSKCVYVGSKNSTKFYAPNCSWAKSIKPENLVCFQTAQEAISQGRTESKCTK